MKILKRLYLFVLIFITIIAIGFLIYPDLSNYINNKYAIDTISEYNNKINESSKSDLDSFIEKAQKYNSDLAKGVRPESVFDNGYMLGYIDIPKIGVKLPIYEGTDNEVLKKGVGVIRWTSIPIGGASTHSVLSAHTGLTTQKLFTDIDKLVKGDKFFINIFNKNLAYEVDDINIVKPNDTSKIQIYDNKDYITLLTCYPYGINTERLLVRGKRIEFSDNKIDTQKKINNNSSIKVSKSLRLLLMILIFLVLFIFIFILFNKKKFRKNI
ncbi:class C sortase (plasmid) [Clostridium perfringens]|uniref:class C sortase n=1 Tax=Clostridium perfringens TaxID=1502 RepID=UPI0010DD3B2E|nr:class C sortase [Clostridium perfringens]ELC8371438.1 class C sortase [Clostridium perfringens]MCX0386966.1 class C sortase [Clostridium perfringens]MDB2047217.1 class C sortase [Clostridium perfringens]MDB2058518.1 class C sortase [Clostridium perfringens]MDJ8959829.1 class C sortase [Clostridium perfringens]